MNALKQLLILASILLTSSLFSQENGYEIKIKVEGINNGDTVYLANYFGKKLYYADTAYSVNDEILFTGDSLKGGKYAVVLPGVKYFEVVVAEDQIDMQTTEDNFIGDMVVNQSNENKVFYDYIHFLRDQRLKIQPYEDQLKDFKGSDEEKEVLIEQLRAINQEVEDEQARIVEEHSDLLVSKYIYMSMPVKIPPAPTDAEGNVTDSTFQRYYYVTHFFDHFDFNDDRIVRDPIFENKTDEFFKKVVYPLPDSINVQVYRVVEKTKRNDDIFKFIVHYAASMFEREKVMGMDAVFVYTVENYYMTGEAYWADSATVATMTERAMKLKPTLIGQRAPYLNLYDTTETKRVSLYNIPADYTILYFWDSGCGHCKKTTPVLLELYHNYKGKGVEVYAVGTELENDDWKKYIRENNIDFINVSDTPEQPDYFRTIYDIFSTPRIFILDKDKKIIAKQLSVEQIEEFLDFQMEKNAKEM
jgi:thiol-disulfide isomerase/thioredoxin